MTTKENLLKTVKNLYKGEEITLTAYYVLLTGINQLTVEQIKTTGDG